MQLYDLQHLVKGVACSGSASTKVTLAALKEEEGEQRWEQGTSLEATTMIKAKMMMVWVRVVAVEGMKSDMFWI